MGGARVRHHHLRMCHYQLQGKRRPDLKTMQCLYKVIPGQLMIRKLILYLTFKIDLRRLTLLPQLKEISIIFFHIQIYHLTFDHVQQERRDGHWHFCFCYLYCRESVSLVRYISFLAQWADSYFPEHPKQDHHSLEERRSCLVLTGNHRMLAACLESKVRQEPPDRQVWRG
jgi:hypothetical protein